MRKLRILGMDYRVDVSPRNVDAQNLRGQCNVEDCLIYITGEGDQQVMRETLVHEVLHAISERLNIGLDEEKVRNLSVGLDAVMADNGGRLWK